MTYLGVSGLNFHKLLYFLSEDLFLPKEIVKIQMKCCIMRHFIWVFTICKGAGLGAS